MEARHGEEALRKLQKREQTPQLILLDLMMPVMDGFGFRRLQREDPDLSQIPVIVLTAHGNASELASELHAAACLNKPVEPDLLLQTVAKLLS
jgi:CheY-like chemotaxis protein